MKARGSTGIAQIGKTFRIMDDDGSRTLDKEELRTALQDYGIRLYPEEVADLQAAFDTNGDGTVDYDELLYHLRGPLSQRRVDAINRAFDILDTNRNSVIELEEIYSKYNAKEHPEVKAGKRTEEDVLREFLDTFDGGVKDGRVTREE